MPTAIAESSLRPFFRDPGRVVIVGSGPAGVVCAERLSLHGGRRPILLLGDEPWRPYDRVRLSSLLAGELAPDALDLGSRLEAHDNVTVLAHRRIVRIDRAARTVHDDKGRAYAYERLVLATGSRPRVPAVPGIELPGVYVFRGMSDAQRLLARQIRSRSTVVIGGGLLGLEAARAMRRFNTQVNVVEHEVRLMFHQLDDEASARLRERIERMHIGVYVGESVQQIVGRYRPESVGLRSGLEIECDTVVVATGISPNVELARDSGIAVGRGIRVDDAMRTSDPAVYAVGECCEHRGIVYGLAGPALEQAAVAASNIAGSAAAYVGSTVASSLKVAGCPVLSMGEVDGSVRPFTAHVYRDGERYRRINVSRGRIIGAVGVGEWDFARLRAAGLDGRRLWPWQLLRFVREGEPWREDANDVAAWAPDATVCTCRAVSRAVLDAAISGGGATVEALASRTGAGTVCGSCKPLLAELLGGVSNRPPLPRALLAGGLAALVAALLACAMSLPYAASASAGRSWDALWTEPLYKQASGYALLALGALVSLLSLRKRLTRFTWLRYASWRLAHVWAGVLTAFVLLAHTGFRAGAHLNFALTACFAGLLLTGGVAGAATALAQRFGRGPSKTMLRASSFAHVALLWPLPALVAFHVLEGYWF